MPLQITPCVLPRHNHAAFASELRFSALAAAWNGKEDWKNMINAGAYCSPRGRCKLEGSKHDFV